MIDSEEQRSSLSEQAKAIIADERHLLEEFLSAKESIPFRRDFPIKDIPKKSIIHASFSTYREQYYRTALADYLILFRGIRSLSAWSDVLSHFEIEPDLWAECHLDYIDPLHSSLIDTCISIKDTLNAGAAKLSAIALDGSAGCKIVQENEERGFRYSQWRKLLEDCHIECEEYRRFIAATGKYYKTPLFTKLKDNHGGRHHDTFPSIWMAHSIPRIEDLGDGAITAMTLENEKLSIEGELRLVEDALPYIAALYDSFYEYINALVDHGPKADFAS